VPGHVRRSRHNVGIMFGDVVLVSGIVRRGRFSVGTYCEVGLMSGRDRRGQFRAGTFLAISA